MHIKHIRCSNFSAILLVVSCVITSKITRTPIFVNATENKKGIKGCHTIRMS